MHFESAHFAGWTRFGFIQKWETRRLHIARVVTAKLLLRPPTELEEWKRVGLSNDGVYSIVAKGRFEFYRSNDLC